MPTTVLPTRDATTARRLESLPLLALAGAVLILTGRWVWVAEFGDFGYTYDFASRILSGETQYADFVTTIPPLSHYSLAAFVALFGRSVLAYIAHLYVWWVLALFVAWRLLRLLGVSTGTSSATLLLVAAASFPGSTLGHAQNHMANVFGGLAIGCVLRLETLSLRRDVLLAGLLTGLTVLTKQNVGILLTAAQCVGLLVVLVPRRPIGRLVADLVLFALGWAVGLFPMLVFFAAHAGAGEVAAQFLFDARTSKGGDGADPSSSDPETPHPRNPPPEPRRTRGQRPGLCRCDVSRRLFFATPSLSARHGRFSASSRPMGRTPRCIRPGADARSGRRDPPRLACRSHDPE